MLCVTFCQGCRPTKADNFFFLIETVAFLYWTAITSQPFCNFYFLKPFCQLLIVRYQCPRDKKERCRVRSHSIAVLILGIYFCSVSNKESNNLRAAVTCSVHDWCHKSPEGEEERDNCVSAARNSSSKAGQNISVFLEQRNGKAFHKAGGTNLKIQFTSK